MTQQILDIHNITTYTLVCLVVLGSVLIIVPEEGEALIIPDLTVTVDPSILVLDVSPGANPTGQVDCTLDNPTLNQETVRLTTMAPGLTITPEIYMVTVGPQSSRTVPIAVAAEPRSVRRIVSVTVRAEVVKVNGIDTLTGYETYTGFQVMVNQYARVVLTVSEPFQKVKPGKEYPLSLKVFNDGNDRDRFEISCTNKKELEDAGFSIVIVPSVTQDVDPGKHIEVKVIVQTPKGLWVNEYHSLEFAAQSRLRGSNERITMSMTQWVWGMYVPTFDPVFTLIAAAVMAVGLKGRLGGKKEDEEIPEWL